MLLYFPISSAGLQLFNYTAFPSADNLNFTTHSLKIKYQEQNQHFLNINITFILYNSYIYIIK